MNELKILNVMSKQAPDGSICGCIIVRDEKAKGKVIYMGSNNKENKENLIQDVISNGIRLTTTQLDYLIDAMDGIDASKKTIEDINKEATKRT